LINDGKMMLTSRPTV